jgi:uncharacterized protein (TIGR02001 family)
MIYKTLTLLCGALVASGALTQAQAAEPDYTLGFNVGATTDYRFRGISQTSFDPALQGGVDFSHKSGLYLGAWASNIKWIKDYVGATKGSTELDLYGGFKGEIVKDLAFDLGVIRYQYPGNTAAAVLVNANTTEVYGALTYNVFTVKYSRAVSNFIANPSSSGSGYLEAAATIDLGSGFSLTPHLGHQTVDNVVGHVGNYTDYSLTLAKDFGNGFAVTAAAIGTNAKRAFYTNPPDGKNLGKSTLVVGVKYSF